MQSTIQKSKSNHFNIYRLSIKLLPLIVGCLLFACSQPKETKQVLSTKNQFQISESAVNINTASTEELKKLPHVGEKTANEIVKHREKYGKFRKPEHLLLIRGISDEHFCEIRNLVKVE